MNMILMKMEFPDPLMKIFLILNNFIMQRALYGILISMASIASKLRQLQSKACQATQFVSKHGEVYYKQMLEQNKEHIQEPPTVETCNRLAKQLFYTRLASLPGRREALRKEVDQVKQAWQNRKDVKVEELGVAALFGLECFAWYCAGEIVGRGFTFTGYQV
uniref:Mitochondrial ATP synthase subunit G protein n=2 Tax=Chenopodium quinoa TaxID=63459 RepID=A0A803LR21_CHEQI